ncbi:MAG: hypothetical protein WC615_09410 [Mucilaginibacter sp.]|jgi:hypothetical protein|uniref:hypothetical protein n=1 Tax=Mucilaginibacter sp. TaxID=1882438 RepID=UPI003566060D
MQPFIELIPASKSPAPPAGTRPGWASGPETFDQREATPVLIWGGYMYWTFEYLDNRFAFTIAVCDYSGNIIKQWEKQGPRYIWDVALQRDEKALTFWGQGNEKLTVKLDELCINEMQYYSLYPPPAVSLIPVSQAPAIPAGLYSTWQLESNETAQRLGVPVLAWGNYTYRVYEHPDNRLAFAIIAFNKDGKIVTDWEIKGVRYITDITVDVPNKRVNFTGQGNKTIPLPWDDLNVGEPDLNGAASDKFANMEIKEMPVSAAPFLPAELKTGWTTGPNSHTESKQYLVLLFHDYTYWAFDYKNNDNSIGIVAYNNEGNLVKQWRKPGTRYLWSITLDPRRKTVTFWGQANQTVVMGWDELKVN